MGLNTLWRVAAGLLIECVVLIHLSLWDLSRAPTLESNLNYNMIIHATTKNCLPRTEDCTSLFTLDVLDRMTGRAGPLLRNYKLYGDNLFLKALLMDFIRGKRI